MNKLEFANNFLSREGYLRIDFQFTWIGETHIKNLQCKIHKIEDIKIILEQLEEDIKKLAQSPSKG